MGGRIDPADLPHGISAAHFTPPDPAEVKRAAAAQRARSYLEQLPFRAWLMVNTSAKALAAAGAV